MDDRSPKFFSLNVENGCKIIGVCDAFLAVLLAGNLISSLVYGTVWLNSAVGFVTLAAAVASLTCQWYAFRDKDSIYLVVPVVFQVIALCWSLILVLAGIFSVTSGHLWPLQSILGIKPAEIKISKDIRDKNYLSPEDTDPETARAILGGQLAVGFALVLLLSKMWAYVILRMTYSYYIKYDIYDKFDYMTKYSQVAQKDFDYEGDGQGDGQGDPDEGLEGDYETDYD